MQTENILVLADAFAAHTGRAVSTVSTYAANDGKWLKNLRAGSGCTIRKANDVVLWFADHWPVDLEWPRTIPRPSKTKKEAA